MIRIAAMSMALAALVLAGCSSDEAATTTTTAPATTTTTQPEITDAEIIANINDQMRPALEAAFETETAGCVLAILEEAGTGELGADDVVPAYDERCGVSATAVTGVLTAAVLVERGADDVAAACVAAAIEVRTYDEVAAMDENATNDLYETCGIDVAALGG